MHHPVHLICDRLMKPGVRVLSGNYTLDSDMQRRGLAAVDTFASAIEVYRIDETFVDMTPFADRDLIAHADAGRDEVQRGTTIQTYVGIGPISSRRRAS